MLFTWPTSGGGGHKVVAAAAAAAAAAGQARLAHSEPDLTAGWQQRDVGRPWLERRRRGGEGHLLTHRISPLPASFSVSATGWRAGEGSEARYSRGAGRGRGGHLLPALLRRRRRLERGAAGRRRGWGVQVRVLRKGINPITSPDTGSSGSRGWQNPAPSHHALAPPLRSL